MLQTNRVISHAHDAFTLYQKDLWGEKKQSHIEYSLVEALALAQLKKMIVFVGNRAISEEKLLKKAKR